MVRGIVDECDSRNGGTGYACCGGGCLWGLFEVVPVDTRNLMGFYVSLRKLLVEVCTLRSDWVCN